MEKLNDQALISAYIGGDEKAINTLIGRYRKKAYNYILMLVKDADVADDLSQELFIKVMNSIKNGKYSDNGKFQSWLMRIAYNMVIDYFRHQKQHRVISTDSEVDILNNKEFVDNNVEDQMITTQTESDVRKLVDRLPAEQREVVIMRHYLGLSFKEIAEHTGVSINTALGRMRYALLNLRKLIEDNQLALI
ncbi:MAG: sigma-70 family RNA polymerase sigma factor [Rikenellaceae bacterium]